MEPLVIIAGPTAVGKSDISVGLAKEIGGEIISADSIQVYKHLDIGSAKISEDEMQGIPHYLIDILEPDMDFDVSFFQKEAKSAIEDIRSRGHIPIIVGGTGFYIQALLYDIDFTEEDHDDSYREELYKLSEEKGPEYLHSCLMDVDPEYADTVHFNNVKRVVRALEYNHFTGKKFSDYNEEQKKRESVYNHHYFALNLPREVLYSRIDKRVDLMVDNGLLDEIDSLVNMGINDSMQSMQGIGYKELFMYKKGELSLEEAIELIKKNSRNYAKRQLTWLRRERNVSFIEKNEFSSDNEIIKKMKEILKDEGII